LTILPEFSAGSGGEVPSTGINFTQEELLVLFSLLKKSEARLNAKERQILVKIERTLYEHLSIADIESRLGGTVGYA